jgi:hypothetical protein
MVYYTINNQYQLADTISSSVITYAHTYLCYYLEGSINYLQLIPTTWRTVKSSDSNILKLQTLWGFGFPIHTELIYCVEIFAILGACTCSYVNCFYVSILLDYVIGWSPWMLASHCTEDWEFLWSVSTALMRHQSFNWTKGASDNVAFLMFLRWPSRTFFAIFIISFRLTPHKSTQWSPNLNYSVQRNCYQTVLSVFWSKL